MAAPTIYQNGVQNLANQTGYFTFDNGGPQLGRIPVTVGTFTANGATAVSVTGVPITASSDVNFTLKTVGGTVGAAPAIQTITVGAAGSFTVAGTASDTSVYTYTITG
jgi:hypothetical protein